jgi:secondary thiamine-phosphate synthase enzyme
MKTHTDYLWFHTPKRRELVNITERVGHIVAQSGVKDGFCLVSAMHITAAVWVNDEESGLKEDVMKWLDEVAPAKPDYLHHSTGEDNADAHLKRTVLGHQVTLPITEGRLDLGPWEQVFYAEFDGQRRKRVVVKVMACEPRIRNHEHPGRTHRPHFGSSPYSAHRRLTRSTTSGDMRISSGHSRTIPSPAILCVASMPIFPPAPSAGAA